MSKYFSLIPRVRVNYNTLDLIKALFTSEKKHKFRNLTKKIISDYFQNENILLTSSGRGAIYLVLKSLKQKKVVIPAYTCMVVKEAAVLSGKEIIYAPTSKDDFNTHKLPPLDNDCIVIATHQYGIPCNIEYIIKECQKAGAILIEDCAGSLGTRINGKLTGTFGHYSCFSFDSSKLINVPSKGGFIVAKDMESLNKIDTSELKENTIKYKIKHLVRGFIYCMVKGKYMYRIFHYLTMGRKNKMHISENTEISLTKGEFYTHGFYEWQARIAYRQLAMLDEIIKRRDYIYSQYDKNIDNAIIKKPPYIKDSSCIRYTVQTNEQAVVYNYCLKHGVDMGFSFNHISSPSSFKNEHTIATSILNVPFYFKLKDNEMYRVIRVLNSIKL